MGDAHLVVEEEIIMAKKKATAKKTVASSPADPSLANLQKIDHLVVLMMENRSFDQMLGYLKLSGRADVDGLDLGMANTYQPNGGGVPLRVGVAPAVSTGMAGFHDPCHASACIDRQISGNMGGFVQNYHDTFPHDDPTIVMRYFQAKDLPVYDFLAQQFTIGDRWFASVPGDTWPNRLYSVAGSAAGSRDGKALPIYSKATFVRQLDALNVTWKAYGDPQHRTISQSDNKYRSSPNYEQLRGPHMSFIGDAQRGQLPSVSWIDPAFYSNDDHPTTDVAHGQALVSLIYAAIAKSPQWSKTLLVVVYDEHGGFFDHVSPPAAVDDDMATFGRYGVRVPAFFVGAHVEPGRCVHTVFDHTSLLQTIFQRFCSTDGSVPDLGKRVANAAHLGGVLSLATPRAAPDLPQPVVTALANFAADQFVASLSGGPPPSPQTESEKGFIAAIKQTQASLKV
jgi:phospholipase C